MILRRLGNKQKIAKEIQKHFPQHDVSHSASKNEKWAYKDESWRNPFCQIRETATGKVIKDFGVTVHRT